MERRPGLKKLSNFRTRGYLQANNVLKVVGRAIPKLELLREKYSTISYDTSDSITVSKSRYSLSLQVYEVVERPINLMVKDIIW